MSNSTSTISSTSIATLCSELNEICGQGKFSLPNSKVTAIQVDDFFKNVLKTDSISFTNATVGCEDSSVSLKGSFRLFGIQLTVDWGFTQESDGTITWNFGASTTSSTTVGGIIQHFSSQDFNLPSGLAGLQVNNLSMDAKINTGDKNYSLDLTAKTSWGDLELYVQDNSGTWGTALGVSVSKGFTLSKITSGLAVFNNLEFENSAIVISDFKDSSLSIAGITGVVDGVEFQSTLSLCSSSNSSPISQITNELAKSMSNIPVKTSIDLEASGNFEIKAEIDEQFALPGFSSVKLTDISLDIQSSPVTASLSGDLNLPVHIPNSVDAIDVTGSISFTYSDDTGTIEAALNSTTVIKEPFYFKGLTLTDVGVGLDVSFGVETGVGFTIESAFEFAGTTYGVQPPVTPNSKEKVAITLEFTDDLPNPSLLYFSTSDLNLSTIFKTVLPSDITLPSILDDFEFKDLMFYWCDKAQTLPDGTSFQPGIGYHGTVDIWNFAAYSELIINQGSGIIGEASIDPIHLLDGDITLTGKGKGGHGVQPGGAYFDFDTTKTSFDVSADAHILGITEVLDASVSATSLDINMKSNLGFLKDTISVKFDDGGANMSFDSSLAISIKCSPSISLGNVNLGTIHIDDSMTGSIDISFSDGNLSAEIDAKFDFNGVKFDFKYDVGASLTDLSDLASVIENKILDEAEQIFSSYFSDVTHYIDAIGKGILTGGEFVVNVLYHVYNKSITELFEVLADLPSSYHVDGTLDFPIDLKASIPGESVHADLGHILNVHGDLHTDHDTFLGHVDLSEFDEHADLSASKSVSTPSFDVTILDIDPSQHFDMSIPPSVHVDASSPHVDVNPHLDAALVGGSLGVSGHVEVNGTVDLTNIDLDAHAKFDLSAHAGAHADVAHIGQHADTSAHIDQSI